MNYFASLGIFIHQECRTQRSGCPFPFFFLFFEPIPILSYFKTKTSYFSYFLAGEAKIVTKLKMEFLVVRLKSESYHKASSMLTLML